MSRPLFWPRPPFSAAPTRPSRAAFLVNALRPKMKFASIIGSYGWGGKAVESLVAMLGNIKVDLLEPVLAKGMPTENDYQALDKLAAAIAEKHRGIGVLS